MNPWIPRIIIVVLAMAVLPLVVNGVAHLTTQAVEAVGRGVQGLLAPLSDHGSDRIEGVIKLCLYLVAVVFLAKFLFRARK